MHFAGVCTEPDPRQATVMSNFGISPSAADAICEPRTLTHTESTIARLMGHPRTACLNVPGFGLNKQSVTSIPKRLWPRSRMSALGQKQTCAPQKVMTALPLKADVGAAQINVRFGPKADLAFPQGAIFECLSL
jgi:hypothetical protein